MSKEKVTVSLDHMIWILGAPNGTFVEVWPYGHSVQMVVEPDGTEKKTIIEFSAETARSLALHLTKLEQLLDGD